MESSDEDVCKIRIGGRRTAVSVIDGSGKLVWRGIVDTDSEMIDAKRFALRNWGLRLVKRLSVRSAPERRSRQSWLSCLDECGRQGEAMARHYLCEAVNVLLTMGWRTLKRPSRREPRTSRSINRRI
jgi:hypothetical protein